MQSATTRTHRLALVVLTSLSAAMVAGCAQGQLDAPANPPSGSGSSVPVTSPIDYHGFPYNIQAG